MSLAVLDGGTFYHHAAIQGARYRDLFDRTIYMPELTPAQLDDVTVLIVPDRIHPDLLRASRQILIDFAQSSGTLVVFGENQAETWLPGVSWTPRPTNFWWWLDKDANPGLRVPTPGHPIFRFVPPRDFVWHYHGLLTVPPGAISVAEIAPEADAEGRGGAIFYDHPHVGGTGGRLIVSTLDPFYHNGSFFMPAATRFLAGMLDWMDHEFS